MSRSTPLLSDLAQNLVVPTGIVTTGWPSTAFHLRKLGLAFDPWQVSISKLALAKRCDGTYAAGIGGIGWAIPRQVGKTFTVGGLVMALCLQFPGLTVIWTAHMLRTSNETFRSMLGMCRRREIAPHVLKPRMTNGEGEIPFANGSRILFGARERGFGLGFAKVDILILDEAQRATAKALNDLVPTTNQAPNPLIFYIGTPPRPTDPGEAFLQRRKKALAGGSGNALWFELGADPTCDPVKWPDGYVDWKQVARANPSFPLRTPKHAILRLMENLPDLASFRREGLGIWDMDQPDEPSAIDVTQWAKLTGVAPRDGLTCWAVRFSLDGMVALAGAVRDGNGNPHVEVIDEKPVTAGMDWLTSWLTPRWKTAAQIVIDGKAGAGTLVTELRTAGVGKTTILQPTVDQVITAHGLMLERITANTMTHGNQPGLNDETARAGKRPIGQAGGWGWKSINREPIAGLEAATLAVWSVMTTKRRPGRGGGGVL